MREGRAALDVEVVVGRSSQVDAGPRRRRKELADQIERACTSLTLDLGESMGNHHANRRLRRETAAGSAGELRRAARFGALWGHIDREVAAELDRDLDRVMAMLWRMRQRCA